jgi:hypothetical protein
MSMLLVVVGLVVDVGHAMLVQRQLQAGVDAAALAGAQHLPDQAATTAAAHQYSPTPGKKNSVNTVDNAVTTVEVKCIPNVPGCNRRDGGVNGLVVHAQSNVPTWFGRIIGINKMTVSAKATACSPCSVKPLDIMIVLDRTGSMCQFGPGQPDPTCRDLNNARDGVKTFLGYMDPTIDKVGLALFPPALMQSMIARCPYTPWNGTSNPNPPPSSMNGRYYGYDAYYPWWIPDPLGSTPSHYVVANLEGADGFAPDDYLVYDGTNWVLNTTQSALVQRLNCTRGAGSTHYALGMESAQEELNRNGRGSVQDVIIFLSDGAANTSPRNLATGHWMNNGSGPNAWVWRPCGSGVEASKRVKQQGTVVYTIGYDLDAGGAAPERCLQALSNGHQGSNPEQCGTWGCTAFDAIRAMATDVDGAGPIPPNFYNKPDPGQLNDIFKAIALDLAGSRGRLIDNNNPNLIG